MSLRGHDSAAVLTQPWSRGPVNRVVDTGVERLKTSEQLRIRGVDNRIGAKSGNVALPKRDGFRGLDPGAW